MQFRLFNRKSLSVVTSILSASSQVQAQFVESESDQKVDSWVIIVGLAITGVLACGIIKGVSHLICRIPPIGAPVAPAPPPETTAESTPESSENENKVVTVSYRT